MYIKRTIENSISEFSKIFPVVYIGGPRQVGKTTVFEEFCKKSINSDENKKQLQYAHQIPQK